MTTLPEITAEDLRQPLGWLARLDAAGVRRWLRAALRHRTALPFRLARGAALAPALGQALSAAPGDLRDHLVEALPTLLGEWRPDQPPALLDDLLVLCALLRARGAVGPTRRLLDEGLADTHPALAVRALSTLAGFGLTDRLAPTVEEALGDWRAAPTAWRALCAWDAAAGARTLPRLQATLAAAPAPVPPLRDVLQAQVFGSLSPARRVRLLDHVVWQLDLADLGPALAALSDAGLGLRTDLVAPAGRDQFTICQRAPGDPAEATLGPLRTTSYDADARAHRRLPEERWLAVERASHAWTSSVQILHSLDQALLA